MRVYLMQHGRPLSKEENPERPLSAEGKAEVEGMARFLGKCGLTVEGAYHSGKSRAEETAEIMISTLNPALTPRKKRGLSPLDDVKEIARELEENDMDLLITGHLPHLGKLVSHLVAGIESAPVVTFQQGGVVCLERDQEGRWTVAWMVVPEIIRGA
jgi:phosphohistidine phosphatase